MIVVELPRCRAVPPLVRIISRRHPEFERSMTWDSALMICSREGISVRIMDLPLGERGRLLRTGRAISVHVARRLTDVDRLVTLLHELGHHFAGDAEENCIVHDDDIWSAAEEFCDLFAWYCCDLGARHFLDRRDDPC